MTTGEKLLDDLRDTLTRYVALPSSHAAAAVTLWITATHALPAFECAPRLVITSPEKRCGKTRLLDIIAGTCHRPLATSDATVAAIFRSLGGDHPPTLIIDEADAIWGSKKAAEQNEDLRKLINAGHARGKPALRCVGPNQIPTEFSVFAMATLAGIGAFPETITDRGVNITARRRAPGETVAQFRSRRDGPILAALRDRLAAWAAGGIGDMAVAEPRMPVEDRAADTWEPLIVVADAAGGHWPATARAACRALVAAADDADEDRSLSTKLLADVRSVFTDAGAPFLQSSELAARLRRIEDAPWDDFGLTPRKLAYRLNEFGVKPERVGHDRDRGYKLESLHDAFSRYIRPHPSASSAESESAQVTTGFEGRITADVSQSADGSIRPHENIRPQAEQQETAGQTLFPDPTRTMRTDEDRYPPGNSLGPSPTPASTPAHGHHPAPTPSRPTHTPSKPLCADCGRAPAHTRTGLCDFCTNHLHRTQGTSP